MSNDSPLSGGLARRDVIAMAAGVAAAAASGGIARAQVATAVTAAKTTNGPVAGLVYDGVQTFKGVRYGAPPLGALRFAAPQKPTPWAEPADASHFGAASMQLRSGGSAVTFPGTVGLALEQIYSTPDDVQRQNEDCLFLNVWTQAASGARPVMVWFHGGGFNYGSGSWPAYDGHNLAKRHDVVVVTVNHRLNAFGYLYLGDLGGDPNSGNAGQLDLIASLEWVRDNIASFGGDPGKVTIFGQSGGGAKVSTLMAMPAAKGLFHRAIVESGPGLRGVPKDMATGTAKEVMAKLGIADSKALQTVPAQALVDAATTLQTPGGLGLLRFAPVVDGINLAANPFDPVAPAQSANIPVMIGCTKDEQTLYNVGMPWWGKLTEAEMTEKLKAQFGAKTDALIAAAKKANPADLPSYLYTDIVSKAQPWQEMRVNLFGALLLGPVAAAFQQMRAAQIGHVTAHRGDRIAATEHIERGVARAGNEQSRLRDLAVGEAAQEFEIAGVIAIAVDRAAESGALEFADVIVEIGGREPGGKRVGIDEAVQQLFAELLVCGPGAVRRIARNRIIEFAQEIAWVRLRFGFRHAFLLEIDLIEEESASGEDVVDHIDEGSRAHTQIRHRQRTHRAHALRPHKGGVPHDGSAPIVAQQYGATVRAQRFGDTGHVGDHALHCIGFDRMRLVGAAVTAHIDRAGREAGLRDGADLMPPGIPGLRKAMDHDHERPAAFEGDAQLHIGELNELEFRHVRSPLLPERSAALALAEAVLCWIAPVSSGGHVKTARKKASRAKPTAKKSKPKKSRARKSAARKLSATLLDAQLDRELEGTFPASDPLELTEPGGARKSPLRRKKRR
jgi:para-nitrobenzyl esterase